MAGPGHPDRPGRRFPAPVVRVFPHFLAGHIAAPGQLRQHDQIRLRQPADQRFDIPVPLFNAFDIVIQFQRKDPHVISSLFPGRGPVRLHTTIRPGKTQGRPHWDAARRFSRFGMHRRPRQRACSHSDSLCAARKRVAAQASRTGVLRGGFRAPGCGSARLPGGGPLCAARKKGAIPADGSLFRFVFPCGKDHLACGNRMIFLGHLLTQVPQPVHLA